MIYEALLEGFRLQDIITNGVLLLLFILEMDEGAEI